jgi:hypothetical protein
MKFWIFIKRIAVFTLLALLCCGSIPKPLDSAERAHYFTAPYEFDYVPWTLDALLLKTGENGLGIPFHLSEDIQQRVVLEYFNLARQVETVEWSIEQIYANPAITNPDEAAAAKIQRYKELQSGLDELAPLVEEILQSQVAKTFAEEGIDLGGQSIPPVLFHTTPLPKALILSPRGRIQQDANISLLAELPLDQIEQLENKVAKSLDVSVLIVDIGGVGVYPTMVQRSSNLAWVIQTIAHEWTHNYLTLHPLGLNYETNNELRTMNETTATIVGEEIAQKVLANYYPQWQAGLLPNHTGKLASVNPSQVEEPFDFSAEMNTTRVEVDKLLAENRITEAETYMETRRQLFVEHGYYIRKLNQAYFAFYGGYAAEPGGAAGEDPVGPAVRALRSQSISLAQFLKQISWMSSFTQLQEKIAH